jgi:hypothetical protein
MLQSNAHRNGLKYLGSMNMRERGSFSYQVKNNAPDLKEQIRELKTLEESPYYGRSEADIAGMILVKQVYKEVGKYKPQMKQSEG